MEGTHFAGSLGTQFEGEAHEAGGRHVIEVSPGQFLLNPLQVLSDALPVLLPRSEAFFGQGLGFDGSEVSDFELIDAAPVDQRCFGDIEFRSDAREAIALGAELDEALNGLS